MWHDDGLSWGFPRKVINGPRLLALLGSQVAYLGKVTQLLEFTVDTLSSHHCDREKKLCVEIVIPQKGERVDIYLRDKFDGSSRYRILGYNPVKRKGVLETSQQSREPIPYLPVNRTCYTSEMMRLSDAEFVMAYALQMATYELPTRCRFPGCDFFIRFPMDLRKRGGQCFCPVHFPESVTKDDSKYLLRAAKLLPKVPTSTALFLDPTYDGLNETD